MTLIAWSRPTSNCSVIVSDLMMKDEKDPGDGRIPTQANRYLREYTAGLGYVSNILVRKTYVIHARLSVSLAGPVVAIESILRRATEAFTDQTFISEEDITPFVSECEATKSLAAIWTLWRGPNDVLIRLVRCETVVNTMGIEIQAAGSAVAHMRSFGIVPGRREEEMTSSLDETTTALIRGHLWVSSMTVEETISHDPVLSYYGGWYEVLVLNHLTGQYCSLRSLWYGRCTITAEGDRRRMTVAPVFYESKYNNQGMIVDRYLGDRGTRRGYLCKKRRFQVHEMGKDRRYTWGHPKDLFWCTSYLIRGPDGSLLKRYEHLERNSGMSKWIRVKKKLRGYEFVTTGSRIFASPPSVIDDEQRFRQLLRDDGFTPRDFYGP